MFVFVEGGGSGCLVSSCGWCDMFLNNNRDVTLIFLDHLFFDHIPPPPLVSDRSTSLLLSYEERKPACEFAEDCADV